MRISTLASLASLDLSLSPFPVSTRPSKAHVDAQRETGVLAPIVVMPGTLTVVAGHYTAIVAAEAGISEVPVVEATGSLDVASDVVLALDAVRVQGTDGARAGLMAASRHAGQSVQGIAARTSYSVTHVGNLLRAWEGLATDVRQAWISGALTTRDAIRLTPMTHDAQRADDAYRATTAEHRDAVKAAKAIERAKARLDKLTGTAPAAPAEPSSAPVTDNEWREELYHTRKMQGFRSIMNRTLAALDALSGKDAARARGIADALAFVLGDTSEIPAVTYTAPKVTRGVKRSA